MSNGAQAPIMDHFRFLFCSPQLPAKEKSFKCIQWGVCFLGSAQSFCGRAVSQATVIWEPHLWTTVSCRGKKGKNRMMNSTVVAEQGHYDSPHTDSDCSSPAWTSRLAWRNTGRWIKYDRDATNQRRRQNLYAAKHNKCKRDAYQFEQHCRLQTGRNCVSFKQNQFEQIKEKQQMRLRCFCIATVVLIWHCWSLFLLLVLNYLSSQLKLLHI